MRGSELQAFFDFVKKPLWNPFSMNTNLPSINQLLEEAQKQELYSKLIAQLNKDLALANAGLRFSHQTRPEDLKIRLCEFLRQLIELHFPDYLNLLYIIDVPEENIKALEGENLTELAGQVGFLILKREWLKVWYKNRFF